MKKTWMKSFSNVCLKRWAVVALMMFAGWIWAASYPMMSQYSITSTEYVEVTSPVLMPTPAIDSFTVTIMYQSGSQRSDISQVTLIDPQTDAQVASDVHEGFSGGQKQNHVYTLSGIPASYAGQVLLVKSTVKCNASGTSTCTVELNNGVTHTSYLEALHEYANDKEFFSLNFGDSSSVSGSAGLYAAEGWNNLTGSNGTKTVLTMWDGTATKSVKIGLTYSSANTWSWADATDAFLDGYLDDGGSKAQVKLTGIPFSQYSVIVYCATDSASRQFNAVSINGTDYIGSAEYTAGTGYATASSNKWGATQSLIALFGTNALRLDGLSGDLTIVGGANANSARGGIAAIQVINTGSLGEIIEMTEGHTVMGYTYPVIFRGTTDAAWDTVANWGTLTSIVSGGETQREWAAWTPTVTDKAPGLSGSNAWDATLVDGDLLADTITVGADGYKTVTVTATYEGWVSCLGVANGVHLNMATLQKLQGDSDWRIDDTSKVTISAFNNGNKNGTHNLYCYAQEGLVFTPNCEISFNYYLGAEGSASFGGALSGTQTIKGLVLDLGDSSKSGVEVKTRKLIGFGSSTATFNTNGATVTTSEATVPATAIAAPVNVGEYAFTTEADGLYVKYVAYGDIGYTTVTATAAGDATLSSLNLTGDAMTIAEITLPDGATLTIDGAQTFAQLLIFCEGSATVTVSSAEAIANISSIDATGVTGMVTYNANDWYSRIPFAKFAGIDKIRKTYDGEWTPGDVSALAGYQLEIAKGTMVVDADFTGVVATAETPILVTGADAELQLVGTNHQANRMPHNGYIKATNGGTVTLKGVNLFNGDNAPHILLDGGILKTTATAGGHIKVNSVTMANGSKIQLSRAAAAYGSEGLYIRTGDDSKLTVTAGDNVVEYLEDGTNNNALKIDGGVIEVASGASLEIKVPVVTDSGTVTKTGGGNLIWNGSTTNGIVVSAGELIFNTNAAPGNAFSGAGTIVADGATLDLTNATLDDTLVLTMRNQGVLLLNKAQVKAMQVPAGTTLKVKVADYGAQTLENVTVADDTASVYFVLPSGAEVKGIVAGTNITMSEQSVYTYTATAGEENLWSDKTKWTYNAASVAEAPTGTITTPVEMKLTGATTLTMDVADVMLSVFSVSGGDLTIAGENALTAKTVVTENKVVVSGALILDAPGTEAAPTEMANVFEVAEGGTLTTKGYLNLSAENQLHTGTLTVFGGKTLWKGEGGSWSTGMTGTITVETGASLSLTGSDIVNWDGGDSAPLTINVKGELDVGTTRLGLNKKTLNVYGGATVKGEGDGNGAFDFHVGTNTINVIANGAETAATWEAKIKLRDAAGAPVFTVGEGASLAVTSQIWGSGAVTASGTGTLKITGTGNTYSGGTMVNAGATLEVNTIDNFPETGSIEVNGRLRLINAGNVNHSGSGRYMVSTTTGEGESAVTTTSPRLMGTGVLEVAGTGYYVLPAGFATPLAFENNRADGIVVAGYPGITVGTLSGTGYFRSDFTDPVEANNGDATKARTITVKQREASEFKGYVNASTSNVARALTLLVTVAEEVAEGTDTTLTISNTNAARTTATKLSVAAGASVNVTGSWAQPATVSGTIGGSGMMGDVSLNAGAVLDTTLGVLSVNALDLEGLALTVKTNQPPTTADACLDVVKVKTAPASITTLTLVDENGTSLGSEYNWFADVLEGEYTILQVKAKVIVDDYEVQTTQYATLTEAIAAGVFGNIMPENMNLTIDFGNVPDGGTPTPGTFTFDSLHEFNKVTVRGTNGGVIRDTTNDDSWGIAEFVIESNVAVTMDATLMRWTDRAKLESGSELTLQAVGSEDLSLGMVLSGEGKAIFAAAEGATAKIKLISQSAHTGGTEIAKDAVVQINRPTALGTGTVTGEGALYFLTQPEGVTTAYNNFNLSNFSGVATLGIPAGEVVEGFFNNATWTVTSKIQLDGELKLTNGFASGRYTFTGPWMGAGTLSLSGTPADAIRMTGDFSAFTGNLSIQNNRAITFCAETTGAGQKYAGRVCVHGDYAYTAKVNGIWTAPVTVEAGAKIGGNGTIDGNLELKAGATLEASADACLKLTAGRTLTLPESFVVQLPEDTALIAPVVVLDRADSTQVDLTGKTVTIKVGDVEDSEAQLFALSTGDLVVQKPTTYVAEVAGTVAWDDLQWTIGGVPVEMQPNELDNVRLKATAETAVVTRTQPLSVRSLTTEGAVVVRFSSTLVTQEMYEAIPVTLTLVTTLDGLDEDVVVQLGALKYSATATITLTPLSAIATVTLPESAKIGEEDADIIAINFKGNGEYVVSGDAVVGLTGYQVLPAQWTQVGGASGSDQTVTVVKPDSSVETLGGALNYSCNNGYNTRVTSHGVLRGYLDDGGSGINVTIAVPDDWESYKAILYCATDDANVTTFAAKQVNDTWYTYSEGALSSSATRPAAGWGDANSRTDLTVGVNAMVIEGLSGDFTLFANRVNNGPRGCVAGIQLIRVRPIYQLVSSVTAKVSAATADTEVAWDELEWVDDEGNPASVPTAATPATILLESDVTLNLAGAVAMQVQVLGYGHRVRFTPGTIPATAPFVFSEDTIYRMKEEGDALPANLVRLPGELRYEYFYDASRTDYATLPETTANFVAGFTGKFAANGGGIKFSAGEVTLKSVAGTGTKTSITFAGTSRTTVADLIALGETEARICDTASVTTTRLSLSDGLRDYTSSLILEDNARLMVTGAVNEDANTSSIMLGHWNGPATLTLRDNAQFIAEATDVLVGKTGNNQTLILEGGEMRVRGVKLSANATGTNTLTLAGGKLLLGQTGISHYGSTTLTLNCKGGSVGALSGTVSLGADAAAAITTVNGTPRFASAAGASLELTQVEPFLTGGEAINQSGDLRLKQIALGKVTAEGGSITVVDEVTAAEVEIAAGATLTFDGGILLAEACTFADGATLQIPIRPNLSDGGYVVMTSPAALPDLSGAVVSLVLDETRTDAEKVLPELPIAVGACDITQEPNVKGVALQNNTNNAISDYELVLKSGDMGDGLYVTLTGTEVLKSRRQELKATSDYTLYQSSADSAPYYYFVAVEANARLQIPAEGVAVSHLTFTGDSTRVIANSDAPAMLLQTNNTSITTDMVFDLTAWASAMPEFVRGAVRDMPASQCLISGGVSVAQGVSITADFGTYTLPDGFEMTVEAGDKGLYLVVRATRPARSISVNFTNMQTPLVAPPAKPGLYPVNVVAWNDLNKVYSSSELKIADVGGVAAQTASSQLAVYTSEVVTSAEAPTSMLKVWLNDAAAQTIRLQDMPFDAYRIVLIFSNDLKGAAYAPIQIAEKVYTMDGAGYTRNNIETYAVVNERTGLVTLQIAGDSAWGCTDLPEAEVPIVAGYNTLVTDVITDAALSIELPAAVYGKLYAGLAALQIVEAPEAVEEVEKTFAYTFTTAGTYDLAIITDTNGNTWESGSKNTLTITANEAVTVILPEGFVADTVTLAGAGAITLQGAQQGGAAINTLNAGGLTDLTVCFPCEDVVFTAPAGKVTFEKAFNNNGQPYTIAAGATLVLGENSGITTNMEPALFGNNAAMLTIDSASEGTLRRNYPVAQDRPGASGYAWEIILAYKNVTFSSADYWQPDLLVEEGDEIVVNGNNFWVTGNTTRRTFQYTQTGGSFTMGNTTNNNNGFLCSPAGNNALVNGNFDISGGSLHTSAILAWDASAQIAVNVSGSGTLSLWNKLHAASTGSRIAATFSEGGTLSLANTALNKGGNGTVEVSFNGGRITTGQSEASLNFSVGFSGAETAPTELAPALGSTLVLNAANTGTGAVRVSQGKVAIANAAALGETTTTVAAGATFEVRNATADATMNHTLICEVGSTLAVKAAEGVTTVRVANALTLPADLAQMSFMLNGERYSTITDNGDGTITFDAANKGTFDAVVWDGSNASGIWADGVAGPWVDNKVYKNGAAVTFSDITATGGKAEVTVSGEVAPASITWDTGSLEAYSFKADNETSYLKLSGATLNMGNRQVYDVPVSAATNVKLEGINNTYRLIGALSNGLKTASLLDVSNQVINREAEAVKHGVWCTSGVTLAPKSGEIQILSAMGTTDAAKRSHLSGSGDVTITGGGLVQFAGQVLETDNSEVPYQNKAFSGRIIVRENTTLDITMKRDRNDARARDDYPFFARPAEGNQDVAGAPLWTTAEPGIIVQSGATFRVSGCRSIFGGWANRSDASLLAAYPLAIGRDATAEFSFRDREQVFPHGFYLNGDRATLLATQNMYLAGGSTLEVAGIGDDGDRTDPKTDVRTDDNGQPFDATTYGKLTVGITATIASGETTGLVPWEHDGGTVNNPLEIKVGAGSALNLSANLLTYDNAASLDRFSFKKTGTGAVRFLQSLVTPDVTLELSEGLLGGTATFAGSNTTVTAAPGTTIEAGLSFPTLSVAEEVTFAIDVTGKQVLHATSFNFKANRVYAVVSPLADGEIPEATDGLSLKVLSWKTAHASNSVTFALEDRLVDKGYGVEVRDNGLYLMKRVVYVRELMDVTSGGAYRAQWYATNKWYRQDEPTVKRNYDPSEDEATSVLFLLPESFAAENQALPTITMILDKAVTFASVRFAAPVTTTTTITNENGEEETLTETTYKTLPISVTYEYDLTGEDMPAPGEAKRYTWVSTLTVVREGATAGLATLVVRAPEGYEYTVNDTTAVVYSSAATPSLNLNFASLEGGAGAVVEAADDPCGVVPFAGVYWNNLSEATDTLLARDGDYSAWRASVLPAGVEAAADGQTATCDVTYVWSQMGTIRERMSGSADLAMTAAFLAGRKGANVPDVLRNDANMTNPDVQQGWQVRIASVPFATYDLYLMFAGNSDGTVIYPTVRVKVGDQQWRTFSRVNGWTAPADANATWMGNGTLVDGKWLEGQNVLHLRVKAVKGASLEIAPRDGALANAASVGLAAVQLVQCDDGAAMERLGDGKWSDANGWRRELTSGIETGAWEDSSEAAPRYAMIPMMQQFSADMPAVVPYLLFSGSSTMQFGGTPAMISTGALDLTGLNAGAEITFGEDVFADPVNVILAPDITIYLPETNTGTVVNRWKWLTDDAGNSVDATSATLRKKLAGDVVLTQPVPCKVQIDSGTLWIESDQDVTMSGAISGEAGTFGKTGAGTLTITGQMTQGAQTPIRVSEGTLMLNTIVRSLGSGKTFLADGGTISFNSGTGANSDVNNAAVQPGSIFHATKGGRIIMGGNNRFTHMKPTLIAEEGGTLESKPDNHVHCGDVILRNEGTLYINHNGGDAWNREGLVLQGNLSVERGTAYLRVLNNFARNGFALSGEGTVTVEAGATLDSNAPIWMQTAANALVKLGTGTWVQRMPMFINVGSGQGAPITIEAGEFCLNLAGAANTTYRDAACPVTIKPGAKLSGDVTFTEKTPVIFEQGSMVRSGIHGVAKSVLTFHTVTFSKNMTVEADLTNFNPLTITNSATFSLDGEGDVVVRLLNMGSTFSGEKQLIAWPTTTNYTLANFTSPEAVALSAKLETRNDGLWLVATDEAYTWEDLTGNWSDDAAWVYQGNTQEYPANPSDADMPAVRVLANTADVNLAIDAYVDEGHDWKARSMVAVAETGKTLALTQGAPLVGGAYEGLNAILVWNDFWKLGAGLLDVSAPVKYRTNGSGSTLNVAAGTMTLRHPVIAAEPPADVSPVTLPTSVNVAKGAILEYALEASRETLAAINGKYDPLQQTFTGKVTGEGTLRVTGEENVVTLQSVVDSDLNLDVVKGTVVMASDLGFAGFNQRNRAVKVAVGAQVDVTDEFAMGAAANIAWTLAADETQGAMVTTADGARIRGTINVTTADTTVLSKAVFGTGTAKLDSDLSINVPAAAELTLGGTWDLADESTLASTVSLTKTGAGLLRMNSFTAEVPVTVRGGTLFLDGGASLLNTSAIIPEWKVEAGATLLLGGGRVVLGGDSETAGRLTLDAGAILDCASSVTTISAPTTLADRVVFAYGSQNGRVHFTQKTNIAGITTINLDALDPTDTALGNNIQLVSFDAGMRVGGSFQLGGEKLVAWAEQGWTLRDNGNEVSLQRFGAEGYYTWAGDGSEGSTGNGNWANAFWVDSKTPDALTEWPTGMEVSVKLQDLSPVTNEEIPEAARTLDWTLPDEQTLTSFYANNNLDYTLKSSRGAANLSVAGDFLKAGSGKLTVTRPTIFGRDGALRLLGGVTEFTGLFEASSGDFTKPITVAGDNTVLRFSGTTTRALKGLLEGDGKGEIVQAGTGVLSISDPVNKLKALTVEQGALNLLADEQYALTPAMTVADGATLTLGGTYSTAGTVAMNVNAGAATAQGLLIWGATAPSASDRAPRLGASAGMLTPAIAVDTLRYQPKNGHMIIDPNADILKPGFKLEMASANDRAATALWLGAQAQANAQLVVSELSGTGVIGVEPVIDLLADVDWSKERILTVASNKTAIDQVKTFNGNFMGATTPTSGDIRIGLDIVNAGQAERTYFRYAGVSTNTALGTLAIGDKAAAEITGTWAGDVSVKAGGLLMGNGTLGTPGRTISVPAGAAISASYYGQRVMEGNLFSNEVIPAELKIQGTLALQPGAELNVMVRKDAQGKTWSSLVSAEKLELPAVLDGAEEVMITVNVDLEAGAVASGIKVLGWSNLSGGQKINGTANVTVNGVPQEGYSLRKKADGLYLYRKSARFILIVQ